MHKPLTGIQFLRCSPNSNSNGAPAPLQPTKTKKKQQKKRHLDKHRPKVCQPSVMVCASPTISLVFNKC